ncbi:hypothetical protein QR680_008711 [Steinernema hermaphroditum]|uniref:RRM domain-containing protein n=1 Tax=Steinernema hermaphroditum TaxID=289476 RepID=A0AA39IK29_9BILA|nr:hypothetical protein QR680_008711 [Steinernema hermaphroditum]
MESEIAKIRRVCEDSRFTPYAKRQNEQAEADSKSVYVGNVEYKSTENDLRAHFGDCGAIERVSIITDHFRRPKGYAYVQFSSKEERQKAIALSGTELNGRVITRHFCKKLAILLFLCTGRGLQKDTMSSETGSINRHLNARTQQRALSVRKSLLRTKENVSLEQVLADIGGDREDRRPKSQKSSESVVSKRSDESQKARYNSGAGEFGMAGLCRIFDALKAPDNGENHRLIAVTIGRDIATWSLNPRRSSAASAHSRPSIDHIYQAEKRKDVDGNNPYPFPENTRDVLGRNMLWKLSDSTLFYMFYNFTGELYQLGAAVELYNRQWRFHRAWSNWIFFPARIVSEQTLTYEKGLFSIFDPSTMTTKKVSATVFYDQLDDVPTGAPEVDFGEPIKNWSLFMLGASAPRAESTLSPKFDPAPGAGRVNKKKSVLDLNVEKRNKKLTRTTVRAKDENAKLAAYYSYGLRNSESMHLIHRSRASSVTVDCGSPLDVASVSAAHRSMTAEQPTELTPVMSERKPKMGILSATSYVIGNIIGSGIFITPTSIVQHAGSVYLSLLVWGISALISLLGGISFVELGTAISDPGCDFAYVCYVKWFAIAFSFMWVSVLFTYPACAAVQALTFGQYLVQGIAPIWAIPPDYIMLTEKALAFVILVLITWMNWYALDRFATKFQIIVTFAKLLSMAIIIAAGLYLIIFKDRRENFSNGWEGSNWSPGALTMAFYGGLWSYAGWDILNYGTPEIKNPKRTLPLALIVGILSVAGVFVLINVSYFSVISVEEMKATNAVAALFSQKALGDFSYAIPFMIAILLMGSLNSNIFCSSRFMHAAARQGQLPPALSCLNAESQCPRAAILAQTVITIVFLFFDVESLINYTTFVLWFQKAVTMVALLYMRYRKTPVNKEVVRIPIIVSVIFLVFCMLLTVVPLYEEPVTTVIGFIFVFSGVLIYVAFVKYNKSQSLNSFKEAFNKKSTDLTCRVLSSHVDLKNDYKEASQSDTSEDSLE